MEEFIIISLRNISKYKTRKTVLNLIREGILISKIRPLRQFSATDIPMKPVPGND